MYQRIRSSFQYSYHCPASPGCTKYSISICSNSRVRKMKLPGVHEDGGVEGDHVLALLDHGPPPLVLHVPLEQDSVVPEVVGRGEPPVDLRRLEDEAAALAERDDLLHRHDVLRLGGHGGKGSGVRGELPAITAFPLAPGVKRIYAGCEVARRLASGTWGRVP